MREIYCVSEDVCNKHEDLWRLKSYQEARERKGMASGKMHRFLLNEQEKLFLRLSLTQHH